MFVCGAPALPPQPPHWSTTGRRGAQDARCLAQVRQFLLDRCPPDQHQRLSVALTGKPGEGVGLLINERMINFPPQLVPNMLDSLCQDMAWALDNAENEQEAAEFRFDHLVVVSPCSEEVDASAGSHALSADPEAADAGPTAVYFDRFEEEFLAEGAKVSFSFDSADVHSGKRKRFSVNLVERGTFDRNVARLVGPTNARERT